MNYGPLFLVFGCLVIVGSGNAVNMTDGLDGLAIVPVMIAAATFGVIAYVVGRVDFAEYLQVLYTPGTGEILVFCGALLGAGLGFLWWNAPPAMIFMGDTGSLSLGGALGVIAVAVKHEIVLAIVGGLFVLEMVSVMVQVASFKLTGKRVFRMAPIHHHYEKKGWAEATIVIRFWIIAVVLALIGLAMLVHVLGQGMVSVGLKRVDEATGSMILLLQPFVASILGAVILGELLNQWHIMGSAAVVVALLIATRRRRTL